MNLKIRIKRLYLKSLKDEYDKAWAEAVVAWTKYYDARKRENAARSAYWAVKHPAVAAQNKVPKARQKAKRKK